MCRLLKLVNSFSRRKNKCERRETDKNGSFALFSATLDICQLEELREAVADAVKGKDRRLE